MSTWKVPYYVVPEWPATQNHIHRKLKLQATIFHLSTGQIGQIERESAVDYVTRVINT